MKQKEPKFAEGDKVSMHRKTLYGETEGVIVEVTKAFRVVRRIYSGGRAIPEHDGLVTLERDIKQGNYKLPYRFDGVTLEVDFPESDYGSFVQKAYTSVSEFFEYCYTVKTKEMLTIYSERQLKKI